MSALAGHPFNLGEDWDRALTDRNPDWDRIFQDYNRGVDWPASQFWNELSAANADALVLLSVRDSAKTWYEAWPRPSYRLLEWHRRRVRIYCNSSSALQEQESGTTPGRC